MNQLDIFNAISAERVRQEQLKASGKFSHTCADDIRPYSKSFHDFYFVLLNEMRRHNDTKEPSKFEILMEEVLEIYEERENPENMKEELIQVMAVCCAWLESLD